MDAVIQIFARGASKNCLNWAMRLLPSAHEQNPWRCYNCSEYCMCHNCSVCVRILSGTTRKCLSECRNMDRHARKIIRGGTLTISDLSEFFRQAITISRQIRQPIGRSLNCQTKGRCTHQHFKWCPPLLTSIALQLIIRRPAGNSCRGINTKFHRRNGRPAVNQLKPGKNSVERDGRDRRRLHHPQGHALDGLPLQLLGRTIFVGE